MARIHQEREAKTQRLNTIYRDKNFLNQKHEERTNALNENCAKVKKHDAQVQNLEVEVANLKAEAFQLKFQLPTTKSVHSQAFGYYYGASLERLKAFLLANPQTELGSLNLESLKPNTTSQQQLNKIGTCSIPNAFPT